MDKAIASSLLIVALLVGGMFFYSDVGEVQKNPGQDRDPIENTDYEVRDIEHDYDENFCGDDNIWGHSLENSPYKEEWERVTENMEDIPTANEIENLMYDAPRWEKGPLMWHDDYKTRKAAIKDLEQYGVEYHIKDGKIVIDSPGIYLFGPGSEKCENQYKVKDFYRCDGKICSRIIYKDAEYIIGNYEGEAAKENYGKSVGYIGFRNALSMCRYFENHGIKCGIGAVNFPNAAPQAHVAVPVKSGIAFVERDSCTNYDFSGNYIMVNWKPGDKNVQYLNQDHTGIDNERIQKVWVHWRHGHGDYENVKIYR